MTDNAERPLALTDFQVEIARLFAGLPAAEGFLLAGGAALAAHHLTTRPTRDLDFFTQPATGSVAVVRDQFATAVRDRGWQVEYVKDTDTFCRLIVRGPEDLLVDLAVDSPPTWPPTVSFLGPTFAPEELAGRKLVALFDRAEARDFADVYVLAQRFGKAMMLEQALKVDGGVEAGVLASMMARLERFDDGEIPVAAEAVAALREFFADWQSELTAP